jgi:hypothetical protein
VNARKTRGRVVSQVERQSRRYRKAGKERTEDLESIVDVCRQKRRKGKQRTDRDGYRETALKEEDNCIDDMERIASSSNLYTEQGMKTVSKLP